MPQDQSNDTGEEKKGCVASAHAMLALLEGGGPSGENMADPEYCYAASGQTFWQRMRFIYNPPDGNA